MESPQDPDQDTVAEDNPSGVVARAPVLGSPPPGSPPAPARSVPGVVAWEPKLPDWYHQLRLADPQVIEHLRTFARSVWERMVPYPTDEAKLTALREVAQRAATLTGMTPLGVRPVDQHEPPGLDLTTTWSVSVHLGRPWQELLALLIDALLRAEQRHRLAVNGDGPLTRDALLARLQAITTGPDDDWTADRRAMWRALLGSGATASTRVIDGANARIVDQVTGGGYPQPPADPALPQPPAAAPDAAATRPRDPSSPPQLMTDRLMTDYPELTAEPRTYDAISRMLRDRGHEARFELVAALRLRSYEAAGQAAPELSSERLAVFLDTVWQSRDHLRTAAQIYELYVSQDSAHPLTVTREDYQREILAIAEGRPAGSRVRVQKDRGYTDLTEATPQQVEDAACYQFCRPGATVTPIRVQVYIVSRRDATAGVMRAVVHQVVDDHDTFPGVVLGKVASWRRLAAKLVDRIVVYVEDDAAADLVRRWLGRYAMQHPGVLDVVTPAATLPLMDGAAQAATPLTGGSYGTQVSDTAHAALRETMRFGDRERFQVAALDKLAQRGVDVNAVHRNLPAERLPPELRRYLVDPLAELVAALPASWQAGRIGTDLVRLRARLSELSDLPGTKVRARRRSPLFSADSFVANQVRDALADISSALPRLPEALATSLPGLVTDLLLAGTARVGGQPLLPHTLLLPILDRLIRDTATALDRLGYRDAATTGVPDESFTQRLARFGLLHLPAELGGRALDSELFQAWQSSPHLGVMLAESVRSGGTDRVSATGSVASGAVPVAALLAAVDALVDRLASMVGQRPGAAEDEARRRVAEVRAVLPTVRADAERMARGASRRQVQHRAGVWMDQLRWALNRLARAGLWGHGDRPDGDTTSLVAISPVQPSRADTGYVVPDGQLSSGEVLAYLRGDVLMRDPAGFGEVLFGRVDEGWRQAPASERPGLDAPDGRSGVASDDRYEADTPADAGTPVNDGVMGGPADVSGLAADRLLAAVRAAVVRWPGTGHRVDPLLDAHLGFDYFGLRTPPPVPDFLRDVDVLGLKTAQLPAFFALMSLTRGQRPSAADFVNLPEDPTKVTSARRSTVEERRWGYGDRRAQLPLLPELLEIPHVIYSIWLGGPMSSQGSGATDFRNITQGAQLTRTWAERVLLTDVTYAEAEKARSMTAPSDGSPDPWAEIRYFVETADRNGVDLVNIDELASVMPPEFYAIVMAERVKQGGTGYAGGSDVLRWLIEWSGGMYTDGDNEIVGVVEPGQQPAERDGVRYDPNERGDLRPELRRIVDPPSGDDSSDGHGFAVVRLARTRGGEVSWAPSNNVIAVARRHPVSGMMLGRIRENYQLTQRELYEREGPLADSSLPAVVSAPPGEWARRGVRNFRRYETALRAGPDLMRWLRDALGAPNYGWLPTMHGIRVNYANSWVPGIETTTHRLVSTLAADHPTVVRSVIGLVAALVRELHNREGDLHLSLIAPAVADLPDPAVAWLAIVGFIVEQPELAAAVRTVTLPTEEGLRPPARVLAMFGLDAQGLPLDPADRERGWWWLAERVVPARLHDRTGAPLPRRHAAVSATEFGDRYARALAGFGHLALPEQALRRLVAELAEYAGGGEIVEHLALVLSRPALRGALGAANDALASAPDAVREAVGGFVNDVLVAVAAVLRHSTPVAAPNRPPWVSYQDLRTVETLTIDRAAKVLATVAQQLRAHRDPLAHEDLSGTGHQPDQHLAQRLTRLPLLNLEPGARRRLAADPLFTRFLRMPPAQLATARYASARIAFAGAEAVTAINSMVQSQLPTPAALLWLGRQFATVVAQQAGGIHQVLAQVHPSDPRRRTVRQLIQDHARNALRQLDRLDEDLTDLLDEPDPAALGQRLQQLAERASHIMRGLAPMVLTDQHVSAAQIPVFAPSDSRQQPPTGAGRAQLFGRGRAAFGARGSRGGLAARGGGVAASPATADAGQPDWQAYLHAIPHLADKPPVPDRDLGRWLSDPERHTTRLTGLWSVVLAAGGILLRMTPRDDEGPGQLVHLRAAGLDGNQMFLWGESATATQLTAEQLAARILGPTTRYEVAERHLLDAEVAGMDRAMSIGELLAESSAESGPRPDPHTVSALTLPSPFLRRPHGPRPRRMVLPAGGGSGGGGEASGSGSGVVMGESSRAAGALTSAGVGGSGVVEDRLSLEVADGSPDLLATAQDLLGGMGRGLASARWELVTAGGDRPATDGLRSLDEALSLRALAALMPWLLAGEVRFRPRGSAVDRQYELSLSAVRYGESPPATVSATEPALGDGQPGRGTTRRREGPVRLTLRVVDTATGATAVRSVAHRRPGGRLDRSTEELEAIVELRERAVVPQRPGRPLTQREERDGRIDRAVQFVATDLARIWTSSEPRPRLLVDAVTAWLGGGWLGDWRPGEAELDRLWESLGGIRGRVLDQLDRSLSDPSQAVQDAGRATARDVVTGWLLDVPQQTISRLRSRGYTVEHVWEATGRGNVPLAAVAWRMAWTATVHVAGLGPMMRREQPLPDNGLFAVLVASVGSRRGALPQGVSDAASLREYLAGRPEPLTPRQPRTPGEIVAAELPAGDGWLPDPRRAADVAGAR